MADVKISGLPASTTPLAGTEVLPIVQGGATKQVSIANVTAGRAVSAASLALTTSPLPTTSGGTALTSFTANGVVHATSTSALTTNANLQFAGTKLSVGANASAWSGSSLDLGTVTGLCAVAGTGGSFLTNNAYYDGSNWIYKVTNPAVIYAMLANGTQTWSNAVSGSAGGTITFAERMNISAAGNVTVTTGNLVIGTSGKGIDFSATPGTGTSELLADYEEGTWTPTDTSGAGLSLTIVSATYTKIGRLVTLQAEITYPTTVNASGAILGGFPYTAASNGAASFYAGGVAGPMAQIGSALYPANSAGASITNATLSAKTVYITVSYRN
jgi:hypothetical protein